MRLWLNGELHELPDGQTVADVLGILGVADERGIAVAVDGEVIPRSEWGRTKPADRGRVEVLRAVQGG